MAVRAQESEIVDVGPTTWRQCVQRLHVMTFDKAASTFAVDRLDLFESLDCEKRDINWRGLEHTYVTSLALRDLE